MKTYKDVLNFLDSLTNYENIGFRDINKGFTCPDKIRKALDRIKNPDYNYRSIHIAGTKGKGSICAFTASILESAGYKTGLYTSPHLMSPCERISVNGDLIGDADIVDVMRYLHDVLGESFLREFTFFEVFTLIAIEFFNRQKVDFAVFETGLGGRLDATNVLNSEVCGITPISYDHMEVLGENIKDIAFEKAAIIKTGTKCISSLQKEEAMDVIKQRCEEQNVCLSVVGKDITFTLNDINESGSLFNVFGKKRQYKDCRIKLPGYFQVTNCVTAIGICGEVFGDMDIKDTVIKEGVIRAFIPARMEILCKSPTLIIDGAQNKESARKLKYSVERIFKYGKLILILGLSREKDISGVCKQLVPFADEIILTRSANTRAEDPFIIRGYIRNRSVKVTRDTREALGTALKIAGKNDMILATGSFYVAGEVRELLVGAGSKPARTSKKSEADVGTCT
ncbi:MAG: folylpolyglutamate synthase/dihydrofolate synthase family protein [Candidatus Omnitrophota bacterium]